MRFRVPEGMQPACSLQIQEPNKLFETSEAATSHHEILHLTAKTKHENQISPYLTIKSAKIVEIMENSLDQVCSLPPPEKNLLDIRQLRRSPGRPWTRSTEIGQKQLLHVAKKYHDDHQKLSKYWDQWMGIPRSGYLSWVFSFNL